MNEDQLEQEALGWLTKVGYTTLYGLDIACDGDSPERSGCRVGSEPPACPPYALPWCLMRRSSFQQRGKHEHP